MNDTLRTLYAFNQGYCRQLLEDISADEMLSQPAAGVNPPAWLLGHLAICTDFALGILDQEKQLPRPWLVYFGPGSKSVPGEKPWPGKEELLDAYLTGHKLVEEASHHIAAELLVKPNPIDFLTAALPTSGDLLAHLMATHEALHLGHLSNWRRQMGRAPLF